MRAVFAETLGSGSLGIGFELADTRDLSTVLMGDLVVVDREEDDFGGDFFATGLEAEPLAVFETPLGFVVPLDFTGELLDLLAFGLAFPSVDAFRRSRRWTFLISEMSSSFFSPCQPATP